MNEEVPWWKEAVFYQVYPRSFLDANGDGVGDLRGVRERLDHLSWLGVDAVWLSPFYRSPMVDFGYDISDHCDVDPLFGDLGEFDALLGAAHRRGIRVLVDLVPNHTSDRHPWFVESRSSRFSRKRDWYIWRDGCDGTPPNNWRAAFGGPAWTWDDATQQWYLHLFLPEQPDLNRANDEVAEAMHGVMRFWLDRGVDGFRVDVVHCIGKDELLPNQPPEFGEVDRVGIHDYAGTHALIRSMRAGPRPLSRRTRDGRRGQPARDDQDRHVLRRRRRTPPRLQLALARRRLARGGVDNSDRDVHYLSGHSALLSCPGSAEALPPRPLSK